MNTEITLPITLRPGRLKMVALLVCSILFVIGGLWMSQEKPVDGYLCAGFFGLCMIVCIVQLLPNSSCLLITQEGFTICMFFNRKLFTSWNDVQEFLAVKWGISRTVGWKYSNSFKRQPNVRKINVIISGVEAMLFDTYGMKAEELADLMNGLRLRYGGRV